MHIFAFLNFWTIERKKKSRIFFWVIGVPNKITNFQKILKKHHTGSLPLICIYFFLVPYCRTVNSLNSLLKIIYVKFDGSDEKWNRIILLLKSLQLAAEYHQVSYYKLLVRAHLKSEFIKERLHLFPDTLLQLHCLI